jgi:hypothetical protein
LDRKRLKDLLETYTSISLLLLAIAGISSLAINHFVKQPPAVLRSGLERGMVLESIPSIDYRTSTRTLLLALNTKCIYCSESLPFFKKLAAANGLSSGTLHIVAIFPNKTQDVAIYLKENDFSVDTVAEVEFSHLNISGTPSMVLLDNKGRVSDFWIGKLSDGEADKLIGSLIAKSN